MAISNFANLIIIYIISRKTFNSKLYVTGYNRMFALYVYTEKHASSNKSNKPKASKDNCINLWSDLGNCK